MKLTNIYSIDVIDLANAIIKLETFLRSDMYKDIESDRASQTYEKQKQLLDDNSKNNRYLDNLGPSL